MSASARPGAAEAGCTLLAAALGLALLAGCEGDSDCCVTKLPAEGLYASFRVEGERFHASITHPDGMAEARALWAGSSSASIPNGLLVCKAASWNEPWSWHLAPESVRFADATAEACDALPSYVQQNCGTFGDRYCPWGAELIELRDCTSDPDCPQIPR